MNACPKCGAGSSHRVRMLLNHELFGTRCLRCDFVDIPDENWQVIKVPDSFGYLDNDTLMDMIKGLNFNTYKPLGSSSSTQDQS